MRRFVIERDLPGVGNIGIGQLRDTAEASNTALGDLGKGIQWVQSFLTADRIYCVYLAENEQIVREHAKRAGLPCSKVSEVAHVVDPMTATMQAA